MQELGAGEATLQAPPTLPYLCRQKFMPLAKSIYVCRDIREIPREKVVAYSRALQHWAEENNLPAGGGPQLLVENVLELREEKWYLSFTNEEVFWGVALPEKEEEESPKTLSATDIPKAHCVLEPAPEKRAQSFWGGRKYYTHPNQWWLLGRSPNHPRPQGQK